VQVDVLIVGAGPAGSHAAWQLGGRGFEVLLVERQALGRDKPCGEYMSPQCFSFLDAMGVKDRLLEYPHRELKGIRFHNRRGVKAEGHYVPFMNFLPYHNRGLAMRRRHFDKVLVEAAIAREGVSFKDRCHFNKILSFDGRRYRCEVIHEGEKKVVSCRFLLGADGVHSRVARELALYRPLKSLQQLAFVAHFEGCPEDDYGELYLSGKGYCAMAPVALGTINVNFVMRGRKFEEKGALLENFFLKHLDEFEYLKTRLGAGKLASKISVVGPLAHRSKNLVKDRALLLGDAYAFIDPFTGEGIFLALQSAQWAAESVARALEEPARQAFHLKTYESTYRYHNAGKIRACLFIQKILSFPALANALVTFMARRPDFSDDLVALSGDYVEARPRVLWELFRELRHPGSCRGVLS
jgi:flavin-dependent dehydrogenase